jgi:hypothetical protein
MLKKVFCKKWIFPIMVIVAALEVIGCGQSVNTTKNNSNKAVAAEKEVIEEKKKEKLSEEIVSENNVIGDTELYESMLKEDFNLKSLDNHKLYYSSGQYNFVVNFDNSVKSTEIDSFMSYFSNLFISMHPSIIGECPYEYELMMIEDSILKSKNMPYEKLSLRVYINDIKAFRYDYTFDDLKLRSCKYWENTYEDYSFKALKNASTEDFIKQNKSSQNIITLRKTFKNDGVIIVKVKSGKRCSDKYINKIKKSIECNLALSLEKEAFDKYNANFQYLGIVLQFQDQNDIYKEQVYYNGKVEDKGWINVDWMEHKFLSSYIE